MLFQDGDIVAYAKQHRDRSKQLLHLWLLADLEYTETLKIFL